MKVKATSFGLLAQTPLADVAFFKKETPLQEIQAVYGSCEFHRLKQTHSDTFVELSSATLTKDPTIGCSTIEGDALLASVPSPSAIGVSTADCLPVMIVSPNLLAGIHAGWRGVENEITMKSLGGRITIPKETFAFVGPHIQWSSFEVDRELGEKFKAQYLRLTSKLGSTADINSVLKVSNADTQKSFINLSEIMRLQLRLVGLPESNIWISDIDTKTNLAWASFRREGKNMGKNLSFVARPNL